MIFTAARLQRDRDENEKVPNLSSSSFLSPPFPSSHRISSVDSEVLSGASRPVGGAGPEGDPLLCCLQLLGHRSVDQRWPRFGHRRRPTGWDSHKPFSLLSFFLSSTCDLKMTFFGSKHNFALGIYRSFTFHCQCRNSSLVNPTYFGECRGE